jgi:hypothetical protein
MQYYQPSHCHPQSYLETTGPTFHLKKNNQVNSSKKEPNTREFLHLDPKGNLIQKPVNKQPTPQMVLIRGRPVTVQCNIQKQSVVKRRMNQLQRKWEKDSKPASSSAKQQVQRNPKINLYK